VALVANIAFGSTADILTQIVRTATMQFEAVIRRSKLRKLHLNVCSFQHQSFVQVPGGRRQSAYSVEKLVIEAAIVVAILLMRTS